MAEWTVDGCMDPLATTPAQLRNLGNNVKGYMHNMCFGMLLDCLVAHSLEIQLKGHSHFCCESHFIPQRCSLDSFRTLDPVLTSPCDHVGRQIL